MTSFSKSTQITSFYVQLYFFLFLLINIIQFPLACHGCQEQERRALLDFKFSLEDPANRLASWLEGSKYRNCCSWQGVGCSSDSSRVISINLRNTVLETRYNEDPYGLVPPPNTALKGSIPFSICSKDSGSPQHLDMSKNKFSGIIPNSIGYCPVLQYLNLGSNNITGSVPDELEQATILRDLLLNDNNLDGTPLHIISKLHALEILYLGNNNIGGSLPTGFGSLDSLQVLSLRSNKINGSIPEGVFKLNQLQILDLSKNNLSGHIPKVSGKYLRGLIRNSSLFAFDYSPVPLQMMINGVEIQLQKLNNYSSGIDLSHNMLDGNIPGEIGLLTGLAMLNLSHNRFSNNIPASLRNMSSLQSLDLSYNRLSGHIPQSLTLLDFLGVLNLSYNELSGRIPRGTHFDTLGVDGWAYVGNEMLCGEPTKKLCDDDKVTNTGDSSHTKEPEEDDPKERILFYGVIALGFGVGFWSLFFVLILKKEKWWFPYWRFMDHVAVKITGYIRR